MADGPIKKPEPVRVKLTMTIERTGLAAEYAWEANIEAATWPSGFFDQDKRSPAWPWSACGSTPQRAAAEAVRWYVTDRIADDLVNGTRDEEPETWEEKEAKRVCQALPPYATTTWLPDRDARYCVNCGAIFNQHGSPLSHLTCHVPGGMCQRPKGHKGKHMDRDGTRFQGNRLATPTKEDK